MVQIRRPTAEELDNISSSLTYDSSTGVIVRSASRYPTHRGSAISRRDSQGYIILKMRRTSYFAHRIAWFLHYREWPDMIVDHINGVKHDNRIVNLRLTTVAQNKWNTAQQGRGISSFKGVSRTADNKKWQANIYCEGKRIYLGCFDAEEEAAAVYERKADELHGRYRRRA